MLGIRCQKVYTMGRFPKKYGSGLITHEVKRHTCMIPDPYAVVKDGYVEGTVWTCTCGRKQVLRREYDDRDRQEFWQWRDVT
jgi:hypothetical protein